MSDLLAVTELASVSEVEPANLITLPTKVTCWKSTRRQVRIIQAMGYALLDTLRAPVIEEAATIGDSRRGLEIPVDIRMVSGKN